MGSVPTNCALKIRAGNFLKCVTAGVAGVVGVTPKTPVQNALVLCSSTLTLDGESQLARPSVESWVIELVIELYP